VRNRVKIEIEELAEQLAPELRHAVLTEDGEVQPCDFMTWAYWLEADQGGQRQRIVAQEDLPHGYRISTIFIGLNHSYFKGPPLWFETMVFEPPTNVPSPITGKIYKLGPEVFQDRYTTLEEARSGHEIIKAKWLGWFSQIDNKEQDARRATDKHNAAIRPSGQKQSDGDQRTSPASQGDA